MIAISTLPHLLIIMIAENGVDPELEIYINDDNLCEP